MFDHHNKKKTPSLLWSHLFDTEFRQRRDIQTNQMMLSHVKDSTTSLSSRLQAERTARLELQRRVERLELALEGLVTTLREGQTLDINVLKNTIQRIDALDGQADGRMGPDTARALD